MPPTMWFPVKDCTSLQITRFESLVSSSIAGQAKVEDEDFLKQLIARFEKMPANGMEKLDLDGSADYTLLRFHCGNEVNDIKIHAHKIRTPSTGYNEKSEVETKILADIDALLFPKVGKILPKVRGFAFPFPKFSITFTGSSEHAEEHATVSLSKESYVVKAKDKPDQHLDVITVQAAPAPIPFTVGKAKYSLVTFETKKGTRLSPAYFQVTK